MNTRRLLLAAIALALAAPAAGAELSGEFGLEGRGFPSSPVSGEQGNGQGSVYLEPELYHSWDGGDQSFRMTLFGRYDTLDPERTHADVRELLWQRVWRRWELSAGVGKVFWGVTEAAHLVDIVNQTDLVEDPDGESKLGQPMLRVDLIRSWGTWQLFLLPGFRERTFPGPDGRLRAPIPVARDAALYESDEGRRHVDAAVRWVHYFGAWDVAVSHFTGTGREPRLVPVAGAGGVAALRPLYEQIDQTGLELQGTYGPWLWKLEGFRRRDARERFLAAAGGLEYTFGDVRGSGIDVGVLMEYLYDGRETQGALLQDDVFVGTRLAFNDVQGSDLLLGVAVDRISGARFWNLEAGTRLGDAWRLEVRVRAFAGAAGDPALSPFRRDAYVQLGLARHF